MEVIVMGVSGSGKSYLAGKLAQATGWSFAEGDDYHSEANKQRMQAGIPLTDADRAPWLASLHDVLAGWERSGSNGILTCSSLKASYRAQLSNGLFRVRFIWLDPPRDVLAERMTHRPGHFMPPALLDSQIATLEPPIDEPFTLRLDGTQPIEDEVNRVLHWLEL